MTTAKDKSPGLYEKVLTQVFIDHYHEGLTEVPFSTDDFIKVSKKLGIAPPKNLSDVVYRYQNRQASLPDEITRTQPEGLTWIPETLGRGRYCFKLGSVSRILVNPALPVIELPDSTPGLIKAYALSDEQALLAKVRYNRLIDIFLSITSYSLQNHLRTNFKKKTYGKKDDHVGLEIDEIYVGIDTEGKKYVVPVQAKVGKDQLGVNQTKKDILFCQQHEKFKDLMCRPVSIQFMTDQSIVLFELECTKNDQINVVQERHYKLVLHREYSLFSY